jgi:hypothetical protein
VLWKGFRDGCVPALTFVASDTGCRFSACPAVRNNPLPWSCGVVRLVKLGHSGFGTASLACPRCLVPVQSRAGGAPGRQAVLEQLRVVCPLERSVRLPPELWVSSGTGLRSEMVSVAVYPGKAE